MLKNSKAAGAAGMACSEGRVGGDQVDHAGHSKDTGFSFETWEGIEQKSDTF